MDGVDGPGIYIHGQTTIRSYFSFPFFSIKMQIYFTDNSTNKSNQIHYKHIRLNVSNKLFPTLHNTLFLHVRS